MSGISTRLTLDDVQARAVLAGWMRAGEDLYDLMDPIGAALLGLSAGQEIAFEGADGRERRLSVREVQPQAQGVPLP